MPQPHGHCKFWDELLVEMFLKSSVSPKKMFLNVPEFYFKLFVVILSVIWHISRIPSNNRCTGLHG